MQRQVMTLMMGAGLVALAAVLAMIGGAAAGITLGGKDLGNALAAMMGAFYGPAAVLPAAVVGLIILAWLR